MPEFCQLGDEFERNDSKEDNDDSDDDDDDDDDDDEVQYDYMSL